MHSYTKIYKPFLISALVIAPVLAIVRIFLMNAFYSTELQNYDTTTVLPTVYTALVVICCIAMFSVLFLLRPIKSMPKRLPESAPASFFASTLCGFIFISTVFLFGMLNFDTFKAGGFAAVRVAQGPVCFVALIIMMVLAIPSAVYFLLADSPNHRHSVYVKWLSFFPVLWCIASLVYIYFNGTYVINNSEILSTQLSLIVMMLYLTSENRFRVHMPRPRLHLAFSLVTIVIVGAHSIANIVLTIMLVVPFDEFTLLNVCQLALLAYAIVHTMLLMNASYNHRTLAENKRGASENEKGTV